MTNPLLVYEADLMEYCSFATNVETFDMNNYVSGSISLRWPEYPDTPEEIIDNISAPYEARVRRYFEVKPKQGSVIAIQGATGTGKTTVVALALKQLLNSEDVPGPLYVDLLPADTELWSLIDNRLEALTNNYCRRHDIVLSGGEELISFWEWCRDNTQRRLVSQSFALELDAADYYLRKKNADELTRRRATWWTRAARKDLCFYRLLEVAYLFSRMPEFANRGVVACIDNVDHRSAKDHQNIVSFSQGMARALDCWVLVPIRPGTLQSGQMYAGLQGYLPHVSARPRSVIETRIKRCSERVFNEGRTDLSRELNNFISRSGRFVKLVEATYGDCVRLAIQQHHNWMVSPFMTANSWKDAPTHQVFEALFCLPNRRLDKQQFENLFNVSDIMSDDRHFIKLFVLSMLSGYIGHALPLCEVVTQLLNVADFTPSVVCHAFNDLARVARPLIWMRTTGKFHEEDLIRIAQMETMESNDTVYLSRIGEGYWEAVRHNPYYVKECCYDAWPGEHPSSKDTLRSWKEFVRDRLQYIVDKFQRKLDLIRADFGNIGVRLFFKNEDPVRAIKGTIRKVDAIGESR